MEHNKREKIMAYVSQYAIITLSITIMSVGVYFFKFPNNFVFGGVTGAAALQSAVHRIHMEKRRGETGNSRKIIYNLMDFCSVLSITILL